MIVIDGRESSISLSNYENLDEVLTKLTEAESLGDRIVTDVFLNQEVFSELYPHQAEDVGTADISHLELRTVSMKEMAADILVELPKVIDIMGAGSRKVANLLRQADIAEALDVLQDLIFVTRDFLGTVQVLRSLFSEGSSSELDKLGDVIGDLLGEVGDVMANEDWVLVADLLEYEYTPACEGWRSIITTLADEVAVA